MWQLKIRLIGRLFFIFTLHGVNLRSFAYGKVFSFMQNLGCIDGIPWAKSWTNGQIVDKTRGITFSTSRD
jgi:hypothetical protein